MKDYYEILEVHPKASSEIVKKAYITLAKKYHPDTAIDKVAAQIKMVELNEAYDTIGNEEKRKDYDKAYFSSTRVNDTTRTKATASSTNNSRNTNSSDQTTAEAIISAFCKDILNELENDIIRVKGGEAYQLEISKGISISKVNAETLKRIEKRIENKLTVDLQLFERSLSNKKNIFFLVGFLYFRMAEAYTWTEDLKGARKYIDLAKKYIPKDANYYASFQALTKDIGYREAVATSNSEEKKGCLLKAVMVILAVGAMIYFSGGFSNKPIKKNSNYQPSPTKQSSQRKNDEPIAKKDVITGHDLNHPVRNTEGLSKLTIDNSQNDMPVYVRVWSLSPSQPVRACYIRQGEKYTVEDLTAGWYEVRYKELYENKVKAKANKSEAFELREIDEGRSVKYSNVSLTLYKVRNGNSKSTPIDDSEV